MHAFAAQGSEQKRKACIICTRMNLFSKWYCNGNTLPHTVGPRLSGHLFFFRISLLSGHDLAVHVYCLFSILSIFNYSLAQDKNKVVNICYTLLSNHAFYMSDNLLQIEYIAMSK